MDSSSHRRWSPAVLVVTTLAGLGFVAAAVSSQGTDLRPVGGDTSSVVADRSRAAKEQQHQVAQLQRQIDDLSGQANSAELKRLRKQLAVLEESAGFTKVSGPGLRVSLNDAPADVDPPGIDRNLLLVHQQDIQAFVNAMWAGGAQAVTLQGQRLITTTGIRCVGNTVVLNGVPYSPPYVIEAVGDVDTLDEALDASADVATYRDWADRYQLGLDVGHVAQVEAPAFRGTPVLESARIAAD